MADTSTPQHTPQENWNYIQSQFKIWHAMRPTKTWFSGLSSRIGNKRLTRLTQSASARSLVTHLDSLPDKHIKTLRTYAAINQEQAGSAFKLTMIGNVSVPIVLLTVFHQLSDGAIADYLKHLRTENLSAFWGGMVGLAIGLLFLLFIVTYSLANLNQARDIRHLIDLYAAERGIYFGLEDMDTISLD